MYNEAMYGFSNFALSTTGFFFLLSTLNYDPASCRIIRIFTIPSRVARAGIMFSIRLRIVPSNTYIHVDELG